MTDHSEGAILVDMRTSLLFVAAVMALPSTAASQIVQSQPDNIVTSSGRNYRLRAGDVLRVNVWGHEEYSGRFQVNEEGTLYYPAIGEIDTKNITVGQLRDTLSLGLEQLVMRPFVTVTPEFRISVTGQVVRPGLYTVDPTLSILDLVALAGGPTEAANTGKIRVFRDGGREEWNYEEEQELARALAEIGVESGDDIIVPRKFIARSDITIILQMITVVLSVMIFISIN